MKKYLLFLLIATLLLTSCGQKNSNTSPSDDVTMDAVSHHYVAKTLESSITQITSFNDMVGFLHKESDNAYRLSIQGQVTEDIPLTATFNVTHAFFNDQHILLTGYGEKGMTYHLYDRKGEFIKALELTSESTSEYNMLSLIGLYKDHILVSDNEMIDVYKSSGEKLKTLYNGSLLSPTIYNDHLYGLNVNGNIVKISLETDASTEITAPKDANFIIIQPTSSGFVGIDYDNNLITMDSNGQLTAKEPLKKIGPKKFNAFLQISSFIKDNDSYYFKLFGGSLLEMDDAEGLTEEIYAIEKKQGPKPVSASDKTLTIYTRKMDFILDMYAKEYMAKHPDINIEIKSFDDLSDEDYLKKVNTDLISGQNIDLMSFDGIPVDKLIKKGFFKSLDNQLTNEEKNNYYDELLKGIQYNNHLYGLPVNMTSHGLFINTDDMKPSTEAYIKDPSFDNFQKMISDHQDQPKLFRKLDADVLIQLLIKNQMRQLVDESKNKPLNEELLLEILDAYDRIQNHSSDQSTGNDEFIYYGSKNNFVAEPFISLDYFNLKKTIELMPGNYVLTPYPGDKNFSGDVQMIGLLEKSQNQENAIAFLKFLSIDEKVQSSMSMIGLSSVNKNTIGQAIKKLKDENGAVEMSFVWPETTKYGDRDFNMTAQTEEDYLMFDNINAKTIHFNNFNHAILNLISKEIKHHLENKTGRDELISSLNNKLYLYYNE